MNNFLFKTICFALFVTVFNSCSDSTTKSKQAINKIANQPEKVVKEYFEAHTKRNLGQFNKIYADSVSFYGSKLSKSNCIGRKEEAFKYYSKLYSVDAFGDIETHFYNNNEAKCSFLKRVILSDKIYDYYAYLKLKRVDQSWKIFVESDLLSERCISLKYDTTTIKGDFNGDGRLEFASILSPILNDNDVFPETDGNIILQFSEPKYFTILRGFTSGSFSNLGDLNNDGADEIGFWTGMFYSSWRHYYVYTYRNGRWINAIPNFAIHRTLISEGIRPIEKRQKNSENVIIRYSVQDGDNIITKTKILPVDELNIKF